MGGSHIAQVRRPGTTACTPGVSFASSVEILTYPGRMSGPTPQCISGSIGPVKDSARGRPETFSRPRLIHHQAVGSKRPDYHAHVVPALDRPTLVRKSHPVRLAGLGRGALA